MQMRDRFSLRLKDAYIGAISVLLIVLAILLAPIGASFRTMPTVTIFLLFSPAALIAVYSLFFERSKLYGTLALLMIAIAVATQPLAWFWAKLYTPEAVAFVAFCVLVSVLKRFRNP